MIARRLATLAVAALSLTACNIADRLLGKSEGPVVASVSILVVPDTLTPGQAAEAVAIPKDARDSVLSGLDATWRTSNAGVATVSPSGHIAAIAIGQDTILATVGGKTGAVVITVRSPH